MPYVESTMISWVDYDTDSKRLSVRLRTAPVLYTHLDVPEKVYRAFLAAESKNSFYRETIASAFRVEAPALSLAGDGALSMSDTSPPVS